MKSSFPTPERARATSAPVPPNNNGVAYNEGLSRIRVPVEHVIGKIKKFRICSEISRYGRGASGPQFRIVADIVNLAARA